MTYYPSGYQQVAEDAPAGANGDGQRKPPIGEETERQDVGLYDWAGFYSSGLPYPNGGTSINPCGFPGYGSLYTGTYANYRLIRRHPRIAHARAQVFNAVKAADWGWEAREGTPEAQFELVRDMLSGSRAAVLNHALLGLDYGWAGFEKVWEVREGRYWLAESKPLAVDTNRILVEKDTGKFAGIRYGSSDEWLDRQKSWLYTYDGEAGELYGQSRLENIRETAWRDWLDAATDMLKLGRKVSGIMPIFYVPSGTFKRNGQDVSWKDEALKAAQAAKEGMAIVLQHMGAAGAQAGVQNFEQLLGLIKASAVRLEVQNFGDQAPAIMGILERMRHDEDLMFAGYLRSARTGMESEHGSRADAAEHTDTDTSDPELVAGDIVAAFNQQVVDDVLAINFGEAARGAVYAKPAKLRDQNRETDYKILDALLKDPALVTDYLTQLDIDAITERRGIPKDGETITLKPIDMAAAATQQPTGNADNNPDPSAAA
jgi:hypothetical protein